MDKMDKNFESYFLNHKNITRFLDMKTKPLQPHRTLMQVPYQHPTQYLPSLSKAAQTHAKDEDTDALFWCFFIAWKGEAEYEQLKMFKKLGITENLLKIEFIEKINANRKKLKIKLLSEIENNLSEKKIKLETVVVLAIIEKMNILISNETSFFLSVNDLTKPYYNIHNGVVKEILLEDIDKFRDTHVERFKVNKLLGTISNYKVVDLKEIYKKLGPEKKMTKQQLYDEIIKLCKIKN